MGPISNGTLIKLNHRDMVVLNVLPVENIWGFHPFERNQIKNENDG